MPVVFNDVVDFKTLSAPMRCFLVIKRIGIGFNYLKHASIRCRGEEANSKGTCLLSFIRIKLQKKCDFGEISVIDVEFNFVAKPHK